MDKKIIRSSQRSRFIDGGNFAGEDGIEGGGLREELRSRSSERKEKSTVGFQEFEEFKLMRQSWSGRGEDRVIGERGQRGSKAAARVTHSF